MQACGQQQTSHAHRAHPYRPPPNKTGCPDTAREIRQGTDEGGRRLSGCPHGSRVRAIFRAGTQPRIDIALQNPGRLSRLNLSIGSKLSNHRPCAAESVKNLRDSAVATRSPARALLTSSGARLSHWPARAARDGPFACVLNRTAARYDPSLGGAVGSSSRHQLAVNISSQLLATQAIDVAHFFCVLCAVCPCADLKSLAFPSQRKTPRNVPQHPSNRGSVTDGYCQSD